MMQIFNARQRRGTVIRAARTALACRTGAYCGAAALLLMAAPLPLRAQPPPPPSSALPGAAKAQAPFDPQGYWVSVITQNWRFRMVVPGRGEYRDVPINRKAKAFADAWSAATDEAAGKQCEAYGAAALMRQPGRLHISWQDENTLRVDTDNGMQTRLLRFEPKAQDPAPAPMPAPSWQGYSVARWRPWAAPPRLFSSPFDASASGQRYGSLLVTTSDLLPGLLRKNGVPYSAQTTLREYWEVHRDEPDGDTWMTITSTVQDPEYLQQPYNYSSIFEKESDGSKWKPMPCSLRD